MSPRADDAMAPRSFAAVAFIVMLLGPESTAGAAGSAAAARDAAGTKSRRVGLRGASCSTQSDCPAQQYCDDTSSCYACSYLADPKAKCDALGGDCCSAAFLTQCTSNPKECRGSACTAALEEACGADRHDVFACAQCSGHHQHQLQAAGCNNSAIVAWCTDVPPAAVDHFPGSRILLDNTTWGDEVNTWTKGAKSQQWSLCYSSFTDDASTPAALHRQCDMHNTTVVFARNALGYVFGGYVRRRTPASPARHSFRHPRDQQPTRQAHHPRYIIAATWSTHGRSVSNCRLTTAKTDAETATRTLTRFFPWKESLSHPAQCRSVRTSA
jgi:hypothetical protein